MSLPQNLYREEAVGLKSSNYTLKIAIFVNRPYVKFRAISWKFDIGLLSITA